MPDTIKLSEALRIIDSAEVFQVQFFTADRKKKEGGKLISMMRAIKSSEKPWPNGGKKDEKPPLAPPEGGESPANGLKKDPRHWENRTRNIKTVGTSNIRKLHVRLMTHFNGKKVIWGR